MNQAITTAAPISSTTRWLRWANLAFTISIVLAASMVTGGFKWATGDRV